MKEYRIYDKETGKLLASGTAEECAEVMCITPHSLYSLVSKTRSGVTKKYEVDVINSQPRHEYRPSNYNGWGRRY